MFLPHTLHLTKPVIYNNYHYLYSEIQLAPHRYLTSHAYNQDRVFTVSTNKKRLPSENFKVKTGT